MTCLDRVRQAIVWLALLSGCVAGCDDPVDTLDADDSADTGVPVTVRSVDAGRSGSARMDASSHSPGHGDPSRDASSDVPDTGSLPSEPLAEPLPVPAPAAPEVPPTMPPVEQPPPVEADAGAPPPPVEADAAAPPPPVEADAGAPPPPTSATKGCAAGAYAGRLTGELALAQQSPVAIRGTLSWRLVLSANGKAASLHDGTLHVEQPSPGSRNVQVTGWVDCQSGQLREGRLQGQYPLAGDGGVAALMGTIAGQHSPADGTFDGSWQATVEGVATPAQGSFEASLDAGTVP